MTLFYNYRQSREIIYENAEENARNIALASVNHLITIISNVEQAAQDAAARVEDSQFATSSFRSIIKSMLDRNTNIFGAAIVPEPAEGMKLALFVPYMYRFGDGFRYDNLSDEAKPYTEWEGYKIAKRERRPFWTEPYYDNDFSNRLLPTYYAPALRKENGREVFNGLVEADISIDYLQKVVSSIKVLKSGYGFLLSRTGLILAHPKNELVMSKTIYDIAHEQGFAFINSVENSWDNADRNFIYHYDTQEKAEFLIYLSRIPNTGWYLGLVYRADELYSGVNSLLKMIFLFSTAGFVVLLTIVLAIARRTALPIRMLTVAAQNISRGRLDTSMPKISSHSEVGYLAHAFSMMQTSLNNYIHDLTAATSIKERIESELKIAREFQLGILPRISSLPDRGEFEIYAAMDPAREVGGDLYDFLMLDDERLYICIGDASDKGVPAAFFMAMAKTMFKGAILKTAMPGTALSQVNTDLACDNPTGMFVTAFLGILNLRNGSLAFANAGHNPPYIISGGKPEKLQVHSSVPCGLFENTVYPTEIIKIKPGDTLFLYTDGVTDCVNEEGQFFSESRLERYLADEGSENNSVLVKHLHNKLKIYFRGMPQADDITMLALQYIGPRASPGGAGIMEFELSSDISEIKKLHGFLDRFCRDNGKSQQAESDLELCLEELFVNVCRHGYNDNDRHEIRFKLKAVDKGIRWNIDDDAKPFNPLEYIPAPYVSTVAELAIGGQGLRLVKTLMEDLIYRRVGGRNILSGLKKC